MIQLSILPYSAAKSSDWISYATVKLRQNEADTGVETSAKAALHPNAPNSHGPHPDPALYGGSAAHREH
ncbi:hypothetical protein I2I05_12815 [Hymenobacter sp. BT683]|uniref:Uncharacterized protein n=1 Tax=Hymenobacter jeongseonensis TaxID=2791027 RepID=A0ABS0IJS5_9BACT|nr:hypothetical protein [Hymenobacter jeongseonensis]MBF9238279.1 hypothetical protein [Hymenobacter jeongseonensis]